MTIFLSDRAMTIKFPTMLFYFMSVSGNFSLDYVATGVFVEEVDQLFDSFNGNIQTPQFKNLFARLAVTFLIWFTGTRQALG